MLPCGEDLGMIPDCVPGIMGELGILSLRIQRMPGTSGEKFADTYKYPYYSVCSTGTHDMETLIGWWEKDKKSSSSFFYDVLHCAGDPPSVCEPWLCSLIIERNMESPSMLAVLPLQDWLSIEEDTKYHGDPSDERINDPSEPGHYWHYRMHMNLETLLENGMSCSHIRDIVKGSGR
jgi:4-alpha-glucanotransferase